jgi:hypothetical protein
MNTILASDSEHDSNGSEPKSEWRRGPSAYDVLCRPPPWYHFFKQFFYMLLTFFINFFLGHTLILSQVFIVSISYVFHRLSQNYDKKKVRIRWVRTPTGRRIHRYGGTLRTHCLRRLRTNSAELRTVNVGSAAHFSSPCNLCSKLYSLYHLCATLVIWVSSGIYTECVALHTSTVKGLRPVTQRYDTDSRTLIIDNGCSASITNDWKDFIYPPFKVNASI